MQQQPTKNESRSTQTTSGKSNDEPSHKMHPQQQSAVVFIGADPTKSESVQPLTKTPTPNEHKTATRSSTNAPLRSCLKVKTLNESLLGVEESLVCLSVRQHIQGEGRGEGSRRRKVIQFSSATVYYLNQTLGDNPSVRFGAPIALGWNCLYQQHYPDLLSYEMAEHPYAPKSLKLLSISAERRQRLLFEQGFAIPDIRQVMDQIMDLREEAKRNKSDFDDDNEITTTTDAAAARTIEMNREDARERVVNMAAVEKSFPPKKLRLEDPRSCTGKHNARWITKLFQGKRQWMSV